MSVDGQRTAQSAEQQYAVSSVDAPTQNASSTSSPVSSFNTRLALFAARQPEHTINSVSGAIAGAASGIVTCPLDVIKTKLQGQGSFRRRNAGGPTMAATPSYRGMLGTASVIWQQDGLRGMYRGLGPMLLGYLPTWAVYMTAYGSSRDYFYEKIDNKTVAQIFASVTAGACSTVTTNPIWVIKTRLMSQVGATASKDTRTPWHYHNTLDAFRKMYRTEGIGSFYSGLGPALLGLTHVAIQFPLYEYLKMEFTGVEMGAQASTDEVSHTFGILAATFLSKVCATSATYPHEVLRTRLQTQQKRRAMARHSVTDPKLNTTTESALESSAKAEVQVPRYQGILSTCRTILREEGWRAFYYGMGTNLIRAVPAAMTTMLTFETMKRYIHGLQKQGRELQDA